VPENSWLREEDVGVLALERGGDAGLVPVWGGWFVCVLIRGERVGLVPV
jgi:hypothetical protein